jgi:hypothetical protein
MKKMLVLLCVYCTALLSCAHVETVRETELQNLGALESGVIFPISLRAEDPLLVESGCKLDLRKGDLVTEYAVDLRAGKQVLFAKLPPGDYRFHDLFCFGRSWDLTHYAWPGFKSLDGKISLVDPMELRLSDTKMLSASTAGRKKAQRDLLPIFGRLTDAARARVVSAYHTAMPLSVDMVQELASYGEREIHDDSSGKLLEKAASQKAGQPSFRSCYHGEDLVNDLWVGNVRIEAKYHAGKFEDLVVQPTKNTFTPQFLECAKTTVREFQPGLKSELNYLFVL